MHTIPTHPAPPPADVRRLFNLKTAVENRGMGILPMNHGRDARATVHPIGELVQLQMMTFLLTLQSNNLFNCLF